ncbi:MAG: hypothetical protein ABJ327_10040 [Litoreibacter sp.]
MTKFILAFHGNPQFETKAASAEHMVAWKAWITDLGDAVIDPGLPLGPSKTIAADMSILDNGGPNPIVGITILQAEAMEDAIGMVQACPHLAAGGSIELAPAVDMSMT